MRIGVIGATGAVGREMLLGLLSSPELDDCEIVAFASARSAGCKILVADQSITIEAYDFFRAKTCSYILMSAGSHFSKNESEKLTESGCVVIDNSSAFRQDPRVPLVIPEVNIDELRGHHKRLISNPNCSTIQMLVAIEPLRASFGLEIISVATYQSVSGSGQKGIEELKNQQDATDTAPKLYSQQILNNLLPTIGPFDHGMPCEEEQKMIDETHKIYKSNQVLLMPTTVRVPVLNTHGEALTVKLSRKVSLLELEASFKDAEGVYYSSSCDPEKLASPANCVGSKFVHISRLRLGQNQERSTWVQMWVVADNLLKGAATNAVQILQSLLSEKAR